MAAYAPYLLMAAGTAADVVGQSSANSERRDIMNRAMEKTAQNQDRATKQVLAEGSNYGTKRLTDVATQEQSALAQALKDVGGATPQEGAGAQIITGAGDAGQVSGDYLKAKADRAISEGDRLTSVARELAKVRAPGQLMTAEGMRRGDLTEQLGSAASANRNQAQAASQDAQAVEAPWYGQLGKVASTIGGLWAASGAMGGGSKPDPYSITPKGVRLGDPAPRIRF